MPLPDSFRSASRFLPALAALPLLGAGVAATVPGSVRPADVQPRLAFGTSGHVAANPEVPGGRHVYAPFHLTNAGDAPLTVSAVEPDCGCLTPLLNRTLFDPAEPPVIAPGDSLELIVRADTAREAEGPHEHRVAVACVAPDGEEVRQTVTMRYGVGPHEIRIDPPAVMVYQREGQRTTATVTVTDRRAEPLNVTAVHSPTERVHVEQLDPLEREDGGWDLPFEMTIVGCEGGGSEAIVAVEVDDPAGRYQVLKLPVTVLSPDRLRRAAAARSETKLRVLQVAEAEAAGAER